MRKITEDDLSTAVRGLKMSGKTIVELERLASEHYALPAFASRVIAEAAWHVIAAKKHEAERIPVTG